MATIIATLLITAVLATVLLLRPARSHVTAIDLIERLEAAEKRTGAGGTEPVFRVSTATIGGVTKRVIFAPAPSRITWTIVVPADAVLETSFGVREDGWGRAGDGVQFRIGASEAVYEQYVQERVDPHRRAGDRHWWTRRIDLAGYSGQTVRIIFNTDRGDPASEASPSEPAVWGNPRIVIRDGQ